MIKNRINELRELMEEYGIDAYLIPSSDYHMSEYIGDFFKARQYMSGFSGSAGSLLVMKEEAGLWTDGRYFIQAEKELQGSGITLYRMGEKGVPTMNEYLKQNMGKGSVLGFDGRVVSALEADAFPCQTKSDHDLVGEIWSNRPQLPADPVYVLDIQYAGVSAADKIAALRREMDENGAELHVIASLDDIAWLLNMRGSDVACNPVFMSYLVLDQTHIWLFIDERKIGTQVLTYLAGLGVQIYPYHDVYGFVYGISEERAVLADLKNMNAALARSLHASAKLIDKVNPTQKMKAVKNPVEIECMRKAHIKDGAAVTRFIYWLKHQVSGGQLTEISAADYLEDLRRQQEGFIDLSFPTICGYGANGAIVHYTADESSNAVLQAKGLVLVDSGGQYLEGTTDITRTIALGPVTEAAKQDYTAVLKGMLNLANAIFLEGCTGVNLDILAREPLWQRLKDYKHGTGHGIGFLLNVHEGPNQFRWRTADSSAGVPLEEGMITSDEPGMYVEGQYGIRLENLILCVEKEENEYGRFMGFETLTMAPFDLDAIDITMLDKTDICRLNAYHQAVYEKISPYLDKDERKWLREVTQPVREV